MKIIKFFIIKLGPSKYNEIREVHMLKEKMQNIVFSYLGGI